MLGRIALLLACAALGLFMLLRFTSPPATASASTSVIEWGQPKSTESSVPHLIAIPKTNAPVPSPTSSAQGFAGALWEKLNVDTKTVALEQYQVLTSLEDAMRNMIQQAIDQVERP